MAAPYPKMAVGGRPSTASNLGSTVGHSRLFSAKVGTIFQFRSLTANPASSTVSLSGGEITLAAPGTNVTLTSAGGTATLVDDGAGPVLATKGLTAGTAVTLTPGATDVTVAANPVGESNTASNLGSGAGLFSAKVGVDLQFRSIVGGGAITVIQDSPSVGNLLLTSAGFGGVLGFPWIVKDVTAANNPGGTANAASWNVRRLSSLTGNSSTAVQLAVAPATANQLLIATGSYWIFGYAPSFGIGQNACRLQNITTATTAVNGNNDLNQQVGGTTSQSQTSSEISGYFTVSAATEIFEVHHYATAANIGVGLGKPALIVGTSEVYSGFAIFKIA